MILNSQHILAYFAVQVMVWRHQKVSGHGPEGDVLRFASPRRPDRRGIVLNPPYYRLIAYQQRFFSVSDASFRFEDFVSALESYDN